MIAKKSGSVSRSSKKPAAAALVLNMANSLDTGFMPVIDGGDALSDLIASLTEPDEVIETAMSDDMLESVVNSVEATEASIASATPEGIDVGAAPTGTESDVVAAPAKKVKAEKAPKEPKAAKTPKEPKAAKEPAAPRKRYSDKIERLRDKLGAGLGEYCVLTLADAAVDEDELVTVMETTLATIKGMSAKKQNRAVLLLEYLAGKKSSLNGVLLRAAKLLTRDGFITTGNEGNLFKDLVSKPYSPGAARAMGGNTLAMYADLKLVVADGKGKFVPNADSLLLAKLQSMVTAA